MSNENPVDHEAGIERLVAAGNMTHEKAGQFTAEHVSKKARSSIPDYDPDQVKRELPTVLELQFDEDDDGCYAIIRDGVGDEEVRVPLGADPPETTDELIECIHAHYRGALNTAALDETAALFDAMDDEG